MFLTPMPSRRTLGTDVHKGYAATLVAMTTVYYSAA
jgi:hypothetical protein